MRKQILRVVKIGGNVINHPEKLKQFLIDFSKIKETKILVHGGGRLLDDLALKLNVPQTMVQGRRVTDASSLDIAIMTYAGLINKQLVAQLQSLCCMSLGLTGADLNSITATKREVQELDYGFVGDIRTESVNLKMIKLVLTNGICPVFCSITADGSGQLLNTNADAICATLAAALSKEYEVKLHFCFEKHGVLLDVADDGSLITQINSEQYAALKAQRIFNGGMLPKLEMAFQALKLGVSEVVIQHAENLVASLSEEKCLGTKLLLH
jgi:acetylglutamate kinase